MPNRLKTTAATGLLMLALAPPAAAQDAGALGGAGSVPGAEAALADPTATPGAGETLTPTPGQTPTSTPTSEPTPEPEPRDYTEARPPKGASKAVRRVYRDYRRDGLVSPCLHGVKDLRDAKSSISSEFEHDFPDFKPTLQAAIEERRDSGDAECARQVAAENAEDDARTEGGEGTGGTAGTGGTTDTKKQKAGTATTTGTGTGTGTANTGVPAVKTPSDDRPNDFDPADSAIKVPESPSAAVTPPGPTPTPAPVAPPVAPTPAPTPAPAAPPPGPEAVERDPSAAPAPVWGMAAGGGLLALGGLLAPLAGAGRGSRMAGFRHSWAEACFRLNGAWLDFVDWLRVGR